MRRRRILVLVLIAVAGVALFYYWNSHYPSSGGRSLNDWIAEYREAIHSGDNPSPSHRAADEAIDAIRKMGSPAVSRLTSMMETRDSRLKLMLLDLSRKQSVIDVHFEPASSRRSIAVEILCDLGPSASNAIPRLIRMLHETELNYDAARALAAIGSASLRPLLAATEASNAQTRSIAVQALGWMGADAAPAVSNLLGLLQETNRSVRSAAIRALGAIGTPKPAIEQRLTGLLDTPDALDTACGLTSLGSNCVPILTRALTNANPTTRLAGIVGLQVWRDRRKGAGLAISPREQRQVRQRETVVFNLKSLSANFVPRMGRANAFIARILVENLAENDPQVRELSGGMLSGYPSEVAVIRPSLQKALADESELVRKAPGRSLEALEMSMNEGKKNTVK